MLPGSTSLAALKTTGIWPANRKLTGVAGWLPPEEGELDEKTTIRGRKIPLFFFARTVLAPHSLSDSSRCPWNWFSAMIASLLWGQSKVLNNCCSMTVCRRNKRGRVDTSRRCHPRSDISWATAWLHSIPLKWFPVVSMTLFDAVDTFDEMLPRVDNDRGESWCHGFELVHASQRGLVISV